MSSRSRAAVSSADIPHAAALGPGLARAADHNRVEPVLDRLDYAARTAARYAQDVVVSVPGKREAVRLTLSWQEFAALTRLAHRETN